jgi:hypothetical protein
MHKIFTEKIAQNRRSRYITVNETYTKTLKVVRISQQKLYQKRKYSSYFSFILESRLLLMDSGSFCFPLQ